MDSIRSSFAAASTGLDSVLIVRSFFVLAAATVLFVNAIPSLRHRFLSYGSRSSTPLDGSSSSSTHSNSKPSTQASAPSTDRAKTHDSAIEKLLDTIAAWQVSHAFFTHFYVTSVMSSVFWGQQLYTRGRAFHLIADHAFSAQAAAAASAKPSPSASMSKAQVWLLWCMMLAQGSRRLYESFAFSTASKSRMWFGHWLLGLAFYLFMGIAIWIEGFAALVSPGAVFNKPDIFKLVRMSNVAALVLFWQASAGQHQAHRHLYELRTRPKDKTSGSSYALPLHPLFRTTLTPHYACECLIYFSLCVMGAAPGALVNPTLVCALVFVVVNLGVTAAGTRRWYADKFGPGAVDGKARMIPKVW